MNSPCMAAFMLLLTAFIHDADVRAQTIAGRLLDSATRQPIGGATISLQDTSGATVAETSTLQDGSFTLRSASPGSFYVSAHAVGYRTKTDGVLDIDRNGRITIAFYLTRQPVMALDSIEVNASSVRKVPFLAGQGFYDRIAKGFGFFITPEMIEARPRLDFSDFFLLGGARVITRASGSGGTVLYLRGRNCRPTVVIDGNAVPQRTHTVIEDYVRVQDIEAVEIYAGIAGAPLQFQQLGNSCGLILLWTKH